jgi:hypothetical protein
MQGEQAQPHLRSGWFRKSNNTGAYLSYLCHCLMGPLTGGRGDRVDVLACNLIRLANLLSPREGER